MNAFIVQLANRPGSLADIAEALGSRGINITTGGGVAWSDAGALGFLANDEAGARSALEGAGATFEEYEVVPGEVEDRPGGLADVARRLADAGVNVQLAIPSGMAEGKVTIAFAVDDAAAARRALGAMTTTGA